MGDKNRIFVTYQITSKKNIREIANDICLEQTVEVIEKLAQDKWLRENIIGQVEEITQNIVVISYNAEITGYQLPQLINILYGNISLKKGIKVIDIKFSKNFISHFSGPRFGIESIRKIIGVEYRPLLSTALKPMGKSPKELAGFCYKLALGGIDIIKDDHGLVDHSFCPFKERVELCQQAVKKAELETGKRVLYFPNITNSMEKMLKNLEWIKGIGVGGILISPMIVGWDFMRYLSDNIALPIMAHPALIGVLFSANNGISHEIILGDIMRLAGADLVIYPNYGGRFPWTEDICRKIDYALKKDLFHFKKAFPVPAGGIGVENIAQLKEFYLNDAVFLIGSSLYAYSDDITSNVRYFLGILGTNRMTPT